MALVEGLDDAVNEEMNRIREELRRALKESPHTYGEIASMAGVDVSNIYRFLSGTTSMRNDSLMRVALIAGARLMIASPTTSADDGDTTEDEQPPPFRIVPNERSSSLGRLSSISKTSSGSSRRDRNPNIAAQRSGTKPKTGADQQGRRVPKGTETRLYKERVVYLQNYKRRTRPERHRRSA